LTTSQCSPEPKFGKISDLIQCPEEEETHTSKPYLTFCICSNRKL